MTCAIFHDFPGLENGLPKFHDFPWPGGTLSTDFHKIQWKGETCAKKETIKI